MEAPHMPLGRRLSDTLALAGVASVAYYLAGHAAPPERAPFATALDAWTPFVPEAIWLYLPGYAACFALVVHALRDARGWRAALACFGGINALALPFFLWLPVAAPRPDPSLEASVSAALVGLLYAHDPVGNTFPSLHVANAVLCAGILAHVRPAMARTGWGLAGAVAVSVLLLKQHWFVDVPAGAALGALGAGAWRSAVLRPPAEAPGTAAVPPALGGAGPRLFGSDALEALARRVRAEARRARGSANHDE
jgi:membrane-associated phospholipid phosphatase